VIGNDSDAINVGQRATRKGKSDHDHRALSRVRFSSAHMLAPAASPSPSVTLAFYQPARSIQASAGQLQPLDVGAYRRALIGRPALNRQGEARWLTAFRATFT